MLTTNKILKETTRENDEWKSMQDPPTVQCL
jgi:hypothetical protein